AYRHPIPLQHCFDLSTLFHPPPSLSFPSTPPATTTLSTLSLHAALPIYLLRSSYTDHAQSISQHLTGCLRKGQTRRVDWLNRIPRLRKNLALVVELVEYGS